MDTAAAQSAEAEVRMVITRLFDGMRAGDSTMVRSAFHSEARLMTVAIREEQAMLVSESIDNFVRMAGTPRADTLDERLGDVDIRIDGALASAWMDYRFYVGQSFSHCGVNAIQLIRTASGWKIFQITDTRRRPAECEA
jgi:hypothetical protein